MLRLSAFLLVSLTILLSLVRPVLAAQYNVSIGSGDVSFSPPELIIGTATRIYATVTNNGEKDVEGTVRFYDGDQLIGAKLFSVRASVRPEDAWVRWTPQVYGPHTIRVVVDNDDSFADAVPADNAVSVSIFVDRDTDGDGVPDRGDDDQDNDLVLNTDEITRGTDPLRVDSDGDGVNDRVDVFPLDPRRTALPLPVPTSTTRVVSPTLSVRRPAAVPTTAPASTRSTSPSVAVLAPVVAAAPLELVEALSEATTTVVVPSETTEGLAATGVKVAQVVTSEVSAPSRTANTGAWSGILIAAAVLSAVAAGLFIWLGRRSED